MNMMNRLSCSQCHPDNKKMSFVAFLSIWQQATIICNIINFSKISGSTNHIICNIFCLNKLLQCVSLAMQDLNKRIAARLDSHCLKF